MTYIEIWEPRYRDRSVLIAPRHLPKSGDAHIKITKGTFKGKYTVRETDYKEAKGDIIRAKNGATFSVVVVPLDKLIKEEE